MQAYYILVKNNTVLTTNPYNYTFAVEPSGVRRFFDRKRARVVAALTKADIVKIRKR